MHRPSYKKGIIFGIVLLMILCLFTTLTLFMKTKGTEILDREVERYLAEISKQTAQGIHQQVLSNQESLTFIASQLHAVKDPDQFLESALASSEYTWFGFIDEKGIMRNHHRTVFDLSSLPIMEDIRNQNTAASATLLPFDTEPGVLYITAIPNTATMMAGYIPISSMRLLLNTDTFDGVGFSHIIDRDGNYILRSDNTNAFLTGDNLFIKLKDAANITDGSLEQMRLDIRAGNSGYLSYVIQQELRELNYIPIPATQWYLVEIVPPNIQNADLQQSIAQAVLLLAGSILLLSAIYLMFMLASSHRKNKEITMIAYIDPITKGSTRAKFEKDIAPLLKKQQPFAFLTMDIKKFKLINDTFGSINGNRILKHLHQCIKQNLQEGEFVCRDNADHFDIIVKQTEEDAIRQLVAAISRDFNAFNDTISTPYYVSIDCGCCFVQEPTLQLVTIKDYANTALKSRTGNDHHLWTIAFYDDRIRKVLRNEKEMEDAMEKALAQEEFTVFLQPKVCLQSGTITGAEALVRWIRPGIGMVSPDTFIPLFEKNRFIIKLDLFVFDQVCQLLRSWADEGKVMIPISVNLSREHLYFDHFLEEYQRIQRAYDIPSEYIELELTESAVFENLEILKNVVDEVHAMGYRCSMDDFGSGYSSLNVLREISVDVLKIDRNFFQKEADLRGDKIIQSVIALAKDLSMDTVAEGVETTSQLQQLKRLHCDSVQGYIFSKPVSIYEFEELLLQNLAESFPI